MSEKLPISAILITKNEAHNLPRCLGSLQFCSQIVVVDSGSMDDTVAVAQSLGAEVHQTDDWPGFGPQKNRALAHANQPWVLSVDADEWVEPELAASIARHVVSSQQAAQVLRESSFCGRVMKYSGWGDDWVTRLFPLNQGQFSEDLVHERVEVLVDVGRLHGALGHETYRDLASALNKLNHYSKAWATQSYASGRSSTPGLAVGKAAFSFFKTYVLKQGFRDGAEGLALSCTNAVGTLTKYLYLWEFGRRGLPEDR